MSAAIYVKPYNSTVSGDDFRAVGFSMLQTALCVRLHLIKRCRERGFRDSFAATLHLLLLVVLVVFVRVVFTKKFLSNNCLYRIARRVRARSQF